MRYFSFLLGLILTLQLASGETISNYAVYLDPVEPEAQKEIHQKIKDLDIEIEKKQIELKKNPQSISLKTQSDALSAKKQALQHKLTSQLWHHVHTPGLTIQTQIQKSKLCIKYLGSKDEDAQCSSPLQALPYGSLNRDDQFLYISTSPDVQDRVKHTLSMESYLSLFHPTTILSIPLSEAMLSNRLTFVNKLYLEKNILFQKCLSGFSRITGLSQPVVQHIFTLKEGTKNNVPWDFFVTKDHFCRLVGLKGESHPLTNPPQFAPNEHKNPLLATFLKFNLTQDTLRNGNLRIYKNQMAALITYYYLLRLADLDASIFSSIQKIKTSNPSYQKLLPGFRLRLTDGTLNMVNPLYKLLFQSSKLSDALGNINLRRFLKTLTQDLTQLSSHQIKHTEGLKSSKIIELAENALTVANPVTKRDTQISLKKAISKLKRAYAVLKPLDFDHLTEPFQELPHGHLNTLLPTLPPKNSGLQTATLLGVFGFSKLTKLTHDFLKTLWMLQLISPENPKWFPKIQTQLRTFLTGEAEGTSLLNPKTFLSLSVADRTPPKTLKENETWYLSRTKKDSPQSFVPQSAKDMKDIIHKSSSTAFKGDQDLYYFHELSEDISKHELFLKQTVNPLTKFRQKLSSSNKSGSSLSQLQILMKNHPELVKLIMIEDISGLKAVQLYHLKRQILQLMTPYYSAQKILFDFVSFGVARKDFMVDAQVEGFSLSTSQIPPKKLTYKLTQLTRQHIDEHLTILTPWLKSTVKDKKTEQRLRSFVQKYLSEEATKRLLFGCLSKIKKQSLHEIPYTCSDALPGFKDMHTYRELLAQLHKNEGVPRAEIIAKLHTGLMLRISMLPTLLALVEPIALGIVDEKDIPQKLGKLLSLVKNNILNPKRLLEIKPLEEPEDLKELKKYKALYDYYQQIRLDTTLTVFKKNTRYTLTLETYRELIQSSTQSLFSGLQYTPHLKVSKKIPTRSLRDGATVIHSLKAHPEKPAKLFVSSEFALDLANHPSVTGARLLTTHDGKNPYFMSVDAKDKDDRFPLNPYYFSTRLKPLIKNRLSKPKSAPVTQTPLIAEAQVSTQGQGGADSIPSAIGLPGYTWKIFQEPIHKPSWNHIRSYLTDTKSPAFLMNFEGVFLDTQVLSNPKDSERLKTWVHGLQSHISSFIDNEKYKGQTWTAMSFSPQLSRLAVVRSHTVPVSLTQILEGQWQHPDLQKQLQDLSSQLKVLHKQVKTHQQKPELLKKDLSDLEKVTEQLLTLREKNLNAYHPLLKHDHLNNWFYGHLHRFFPENTEPSFSPQEKNIHVTFHEIALWQITENNTLSSTPKLLVNYTSKPRIRPYLLGQNPHLPGSITIRWDKWDTPAYNAAAKLAKDPKRHKQNVYIQLAGSDMIGMNIKDGVWLDTAGHNRLGLDLTSKKKNLKLNALSHHAIRKLNNYSKHGKLFDVTAMPYRLWLSRQYPFIPPIAGEKFYQDTLLTYDGVGPNKQRWFPRVILGFVIEKLDNGFTEGFVSLLNKLHPFKDVNLNEWIRGIRDGDGGSSRSLVHVHEALALPKSHYWMYAHPMKRSTDTNCHEDYCYEEGLRLTLHKERKQIQIVPSEGENRALIVSTSNAPTLLDQWKFLNLFEQGYLKNDSFTRAFYTFDVDLSGETRTWIPEGSRHFSSRLYMSKSGKPFYYNAAPACTSYAFEVNPSQSTKFINASTGLKTETPILPAFPALEDVVRTRDVTQQTNSGEGLTRTPKIGPVMTNVTTFKSNGKTHFAWSSLRGRHTPMIDSIHSTKPEGLHALSTDLAQSDESRKSSLFSVASKKSDAQYVGRLNTWIPGTCIPMYSDVPTNMLLIQHTKSP